MTPTPLTSNKRLEILRDLLRRRRNLTLGSSHFLDAMGILYSWPSDDQEGFQIAVDYLSEIVGQIGAMARVGSTYGLSLQDALSVSDMDRAWKVKEKVLRENLGHLRAARACCRELIHSLGPSKEIVVKRTWKSVGTAREEAKLAVENSEKIQQEHNDKEAEGDGIPPEMR